MTRGDETIERAAARLDDAAQKAAAQGGLKAKLADTLADDAAFLRKLKPSLIAARARGELPTDGPPGEPVRAPSGRQLGQRPKPKRRREGGPNVVAVVAAALAAGIVLARIIDWRSHAHPRR